jgi:hypothetical protein
MKAQKEQWFDRTSLVVAAAFWLGMGGLGSRIEAAEVNLLEKCPTTLTVGDTGPNRARAWELSRSDIFHLTGFSFQVGSGFRMDVGPADLGLGHCADGAVWAVVMPRSSGTLTNTLTNQPESISHVKLRFHPKIISQLFPAATVMDDENQSLGAQMSVIEGVKFRSSWHAGNNAMIPEPKNLTVTLQPEWEYRIGLNSESVINFQTAAGVPLEPVLYTFKTKTYEP